MPCTERLRLDRPRPADLDELYAICSDPAVWKHFPTLRHTDVAQTRAMLEQWIRGWETDGLSTWIVRRDGAAAIIGYGGVDLREQTFWNLGYRLAADQHGRGYATELSELAIREAKAARPDVPVVAYLLDNNPASARVAEKVGLMLCYSAPDAGNPDPAAIRLIYADRDLTDDELAAALQ